MTMQTPRPAPYPLAELPEFAGRLAPDDKPPPDPIPVPLGFRIAGWIWNIVTGLAGG
ncbi:MAG TPA: hypothetical protein VN808_17840 [Stellaceae bacterium]|nr:hypothetical protein [Stellaceae bacterium]